MPGPLILLFVAITLLPTCKTAMMIWRNFPASMMTQNHATVLQDYLNMVVSGRLARAGEAHLLATGQGFNAAVRIMFGSTIDSYNWFYPPHLLLLSAPFSTLPPLAGMAVWTAATLLLLGAALRLLNLPGLVRAAILCSPAALENVVDGQNGALLSAAMVGALASAGRRPWLGGLCLSVLTLKPQLAIIVPLCLLASRQWRALAWGVAFSLLWLTLSIACFGVQPWFDFVQSIIPAASAAHLALDQVPFGTLYLQNLIVTPFAAFRSAGLHPSAAQALQTVVTLAALVLVWRCWAGARAPTGLQIAFALAMTPLVTPYALTYDMIGPAIACALLLREARLALPGRLAVYLAWAWPGLSLYVGAGFGLPGLGALAFAALACAIWSALRRVTRPTAPAVPAAPYATGANPV